MSIAIQQTKNWLKDFVIKEGLCPFASKVFLDEHILYSLTADSSYKNLEDLLLSSSQHILDAAHKETTALIVVEKGLSKFEEYLDSFYALEDKLAVTGLDQDIQLASFHPTYQFAGTEPSDVSNYTNRSPFPLIHLLQTSEVELAIDSHPDIHNVPPRNIKHMETLGLAAILNIYQSFSK